MELTEDDIIRKYGKHCGHCNRKTLLPYEYEWACFLCGHNVVKRKHEHSKIQKKKASFINRLKYAEQKIFCICKEVYQLNEGDDYDKINEIFSTLKIKN